MTPMFTTCERSSARCGNEVIGAPPIAPRRLVDHRCSCEDGGQSCAKCAGEKEKKKRPDARRPAARQAPSSSRLPYDFARLRLHSGLDAAGPRDARCHSGEVCEEDPLVDYQGHGATSCDRAAGNMTTTLTEHCAGDCVAQHEAVHRRDRQTCCARVKLCLDAAGTDAARRRACNDAFDTWFPRLSDFTECNAYTTEVTCLTNFIASNCGTPRAGGITEACCTTLREELAFARGERRTRCAAPVNEPCPFRADGTII
jgi:hypothetical protein